MSQFDDFILQRLEEIRAKLSSKDFSWQGRDADLLSILIASQVTSLSGVVTGTPHFKSNTGMTDPDEEVVALQDDPVEASSSRRVFKVYLSTFRSAVMRVKVNGAVVGSDRTAPGKPFAAFWWSPARGIAPGDTLQVTLKQVGGAPAPFEAYLMAEDLQTN